MTMIEANNIGQKLDQCCAVNKDFSEPSIELGRLAEHEESVSEVNRVLEYLDEKDVNRDDEGSIVWAVGVILVSMVCVVTVAY